MGQVQHKLQLSLSVFMPAPFYEWWKGHIVLPLSVSPSISASGMIIAICVYQVGASVSFGHISFFFFFFFKFVHIYMF